MDRNFRIALFGSLQDNPQKSLDKCFFKTKREDNKESYFTIA